MTLSRYNKAGVLLLFYAQASLYSISSLESSIFACIFAHHHCGQVERHGMVRNLGIDLEELDELI